MAQKFAKGRWVKDGFLDNRVAGRVVGRISFAAIGPVEFFLHGDFKGEIHGRLITFRNPDFVDDDLAAQVLGDFEIPQTGNVSLMSFDPHPNLAPHPDLERFTEQENHYRIELSDGVARIADLDEEQALSPEITAITTRLLSLEQKPLINRPH